MKPGAQCTPRPQPEKLAPVVLMMIIRREGKLCQQKAPSQVAWRRICGGSTPLLSKPIQNTHKGAQSSPKAEGITDFTDQLRSLGAYTVNTQLYAVQPHSNAHSLRHIRRTRGAECGLARPQVTGMFSTISQRDDNRSINKS